MVTRNYLCLGCEKRLKSIHEFTKHINTYKSYQVFFIYMQPKQNTPIPGKRANFWPHEDEKLTLEEQNIKGDHRNLRDKSLNTESYAKDGLAGRTPQPGLLGNELSLSLREIRFSDQEFAANIPISIIKYNHPGFQNNNPFYLFHDQLDNRLAKYFVESETTKNNIDKFLFEPLIAALTKKLSYSNADKWMKKLSKIL